MAANGGGGVTTNGHGTATVAPPTPEPDPPTPEERFNAAFRAHDRRAMLASGPERDELRKLAPLVNMIEALNDRIDSLDRELGDRTDELRRVQRWAEHRGYRA